MEIVQEELLNFRKNLRFAVKEYGGIKKLSKKLLIEGRIIYSWMQKTSTVIKIEYIKPLERLAKLLEYNTVSELFYETKPEVPLNLGHVVKRVIDLIGEDEEKFFDLISVIEKIGFFTFREIMKEIQQFNRKYR